MTRNWIVLHNADADRHELMVDAKLLNCVSVWDRGTEHERVYIPRHDAGWMQVRESWDYIKKILSDIPENDL